MSSHFPAEDGLLCRILKHEILDWTLAPRLKKVSAIVHETHVPSPSYTQE
jgi:hypothetical protein